MGIYRKKICRFCENSVEYIDYKDDKMLRRFVNDRGKIIPRRISGNCAKHQREVTRAIKRCRQLGLVPYKAETFE
ncbi:MAG: 30S ribosomal protein S18 [candidate division Zixibacteria bacterium CG_4_9_14_3_um_filter_46_8]|nr:MAG: 30S ribosomal protein S18 [candidate division Zixibacteria bacterium CG_4_9_14_3_um_filter_46_8]